MRQDRSNMGAHARKPPSPPPPQLVTVWQRRFVDSTKSQGRRGWWFGDHHHRLFFACLFAPTCTHLPTVKRGPQATEYSSSSLPYSNHAPTDIHLTTSTPTPTSTYHPPPTAGTSSCHQQRGCPSPAHGICSVQSVPSRIPGHIPFLGSPS